MFIGAVKENGGFKLWEYEEVFDGGGMLTGTTQYGERSFDVGGSSFSQSDDVHFDYNGLHVSPAPREFQLSYGIEEGVPLPLRGQRELFIGTGTITACINPRILPNENLQPTKQQRVAIGLNDRGLDSLREAIAYGARATFDSDLDGQTIFLTEGPLVVYLYDVEIDASSHPFGLKIMSASHFNQ